MKEMRFSQIAAHNKAAYDPRNYRMPVGKAADPFKPGDVVRCVAYLVPRSGGARRLSFETTAHVGDGFLVLDYFDPLMDMTPGADRQPEHEVIAYLVDETGAEHEAFVVQTRRDTPPSSLPVRPKWAGVGLHTLVIYSHTPEARNPVDPKTRERVGECDAFVKSDGAVTVNSFSLPADKMARLTLWFKNPLTGAEELFCYAEGGVRR
jgi:hypothetical protein